jgi:signal peptidase II
MIFYDAEFYNHDNIKVILNNIYKLIIVALIILTFIGCDQSTKSIAKTYLQFSPPMEYLGGFVQLLYAENEGGFLSLGSELPVIVRKITAAVLALGVVIGFVLLLRFTARLEWNELLSYSLLISGGAGNLIDRLFNHGRVIDFIVLGTGNIHTGIFNVADFILMSGLAMLLFNQFLHPKKSDSETPDH